MPRQQAATTTATAMVHPVSSYDPPLRVRQPKKRAFLIAYAACGVVSKASLAAKIHRSTHTAWLRSDPDYADAFTQAQESFGDLLQEEALARIQAQSHRDSPLLLLAMLNANVPTKFRNNAPPSDGIATTVLERLRDFARQNRYDQIATVGSDTMKEPVKALVDSTVVVDGSEEAD